MAGAAMTWTLERAWKPQKNTASGVTYRLFPAGDIVRNLGPRFLGEGPEWEAEHLDRPMGRAYFCTHCGSLWARVSVPDRRFHVLAMPCEACPPDFHLRPSGSLWLSWDESANNALPRAALEREFALHAALYDRRMKE